MTIDWTKPCETTEDPPRPVRVLCDISRPNQPYAVRIGGTFHGLPNAEGKIFFGAHTYTLRNVAPPKPEPVLREAWVNLYADGVTGAPSSCREEVEAMANPGRVECRRITWMSDGSPVPMEDPLSTKWFDAAVYEAHIAELEAKAEALQAEVDKRNDSILDHLERIQAMKPVVDAAVAWERSIIQTITPSEGNLRQAVRAYQSKQAPAEPVKNCLTCRRNVGVCVSWETSTCVPPFWSMWEPCHD